MIVLKDVKLEKGDKLIFENVNLIIGDSDWVLVFARNGSGKSSLIKCITGLEEVKSGDITYHKHGFEVTREKLIISYLPELYEFDEAIIVKQLYSGFFLANVVNGTLADRSFIDTLYNMLKIKELELQRFGTLSKGEKKRLLLAITLLVKYDCLILDEPYDGLDSEWRKTITKLIDESTRQNEALVSIMISSHIYDDSMDLNCNKLLTIDNKRVEVKEK